jgi:NADPH2:quinone reductase
MSMSATDSRNIRAVRLHSAGEPPVVEETTLPEPGPGEVYVTLAYGGVNPIDMYIAAGRVAPDAPVPRTLGGEASGHLDGRPVLLAGEGLGSARDGVWAGAAVVPEAAVVDLPDGIELKAAAAMGVAGLTAWKVVHDVARLTADDRVLILGASGGVGHIIMSLVRSTGATAWAQVGSASKADFAREQGAERVVVCDAGGLADAIAELEPTAVFDPLGGDYLDPAVGALAPRGRVVSFGTSAGAQVTFNLQALYRNSGSIRGYGGLQLSAQERRDGLQDALHALRDGDLRVRTDAVLALDDVEEAFERIRTRRVRGKLLLELAPS